MPNKNKKCNSFKLTLRAAPVLVQSSLVYPGTNVFHPVKFVTSIVTVGISLMSWIAQIVMRLWWFDQVEVTPCFLKHQTNRS